MKKIKKTAGVLLAMVMALSLTTTVFAAGERTGSITIDGYAGEAYTIYQILDLTYAADAQGDAVSYSYTVVEPWGSFLAGYREYFTLTTVDGITYLDPSSGIFEENAGGLDLASFAKAAIAWAEDKSNGVTAAGGPVEAAADPGAEPDENNMTKGSVTFSGLNLGYYVVSSTVGTVCSLDTTNPDVTIKDKNEVPVVHKYLIDTDYDEHWDAAGDEEGHKKDEGDNHDSMEYKLVVDNVGSIKNLVIHDYLDPEQLDISTFSIRSIVLYNGAGDTTGKSIYSDCTVTQQNTCNDGRDCGLDGCSFEVDVPDAILDGMARDAYLVVLYDISLKEDVKNFVEDVDEIDNLVNITFAAKGVGVPEEVKTFSYGFKIYKYTEKDDKKAALAGAEFIISKTRGGSTVYAKFDMDEGTGIYLFNSWTDSQSSATTLTSDSEGMIHVDGLHDGTFIVTETKAPDGYNKLKDSITVTLKASDDLDSFTVSQDGNEVSDHQVNVENNTGRILPGTGGMGTSLFYTIGVILALGAAVLLVTRRRVSRAE